MKNKIVYLFSGQGSQQYHMAKDLFDTHGLFRSWMEKQNSAIYDISGISILSRLYDEGKKVSDPFNEISYSNLAIFMVEYSIAKVLIDKGISPDYLLGTSMGEFAAAALSGVISWKDALRVIVKQSKIFDTHCSGGGMIAVLDDSELFQNTQVLKENSELVGIYFKKHFVISGKKKGLDLIMHYFKENNILFHQLPVRTAFHTSHIDLAKACFMDIMDNVSLSPPNIPIISCVDGCVFKTLKKRDFWTAVRGPINFQAAIKQLEQENDLIYIDAGPSGTLATYVKYNLPKHSRSQYFSIISPFENAKNKLKKIEEKTNCMKNKEIKNGNKSMKTLVFLGQGGQKKGMGKNLFDDFKSIIDSADKILGYSIEELCLTDSHQRLHETKFTQPAVYVVNALCWYKYLEGNTLKPNFLAGHSLGEYNALLAAGVFDFETGLRLVKKRGELMGRATQGGMAAVIGLSTKKVSLLIQDASLYIANYNSPTQLVIAGLKKDLELAGPVFENAGAKLFMPLNVSGAFHTPYMEAAQDEFSTFINTFEVSAPQIPVIANFSAKPYEKGKIKENLIRQISGPVKWTESINYLLAQGEMTFKEMGSGKTLTGLIRNIRDEKNSPVSKKKPTKPMGGKNHVSDDIKDVSCTKKEMCTFYQLVQHLADEKISFPAFTSMKKGILKSISYVELGDQIKSLGNILIKSGIKKGDKIGIMSENRIEWPIIYLAATSIGAVIVPFDISMTTTELTYALKMIDISFLFSSAKYLNKVLSINPEITIEKEIILFDEPGSLSKHSDKNHNVFLFSSFLNSEVSRKKTEDDNIPMSTVLPEDTAVMVYMGGLGFAELSHEGILANARAIITLWSSKGEYMNEGDKWLAALPFHHTYPVMMGVIVPLLTRGTVEISSSTKPKDLVRILKESGINYFSAVPLLIEGIYKELALGKKPLTELKFLSSGGAPLNRDYIDKLSEFGVSFYEGYGLTEYSPIVAANGPYSQCAGSVGRPISGVTVTLDISNDPANGEILVKGPSIMKGYYKKNGTTTNPVSDEGWLHTGDIGRIDSEGFIFITGRKKNIIINKGGKNIYPEEVEQALETSEFISRAVVVPRIHPKKGEYPYAVVMPDIGTISEKESQKGKRFSEEEIRKLIHEETKKSVSNKASYKTPWNVEITYEPGYFDHVENRRFMFDDPVYLEPKEDLKEKTHQNKPDGVGLEDVPVIGAIEIFLINKAAMFLDVNFDDIDPCETFLNYLDSIELTQISTQIETEVGITLNPSMLFEYTTIKELSGYILTEFRETICLFFGISPDEVEFAPQPAGAENKENKSNLSEPENQINYEPVAIIGMHGIFPGASDVEEFWEHLEKGESLITDFPKNRFNLSEMDNNPDHPLHSIPAKRGGFIQDIDKFDPLFFNLSPKEAELMDPQQRITLETVWKALEDSGCRPGDLSGSDTGIFIGVSSHDYDELCGEKNLDINAYNATGIAHSVLVNRISYFLNIHGPSEPVDTACSSSLVAIHRAVTAIHNNECSIAIAGGVNALLSSKLFISFSKAGMLSPEGECKTFSKGANGYVRGEGAGVVILKPLSHALSDNNTIHGVIRSTVVNHGGRANSLTAPNPLAQTDLLISAYEKAAISPDTLTYIEAHGTGTELGDPVEINAIKKCFSKLYKKKERPVSEKPFCGVGSVKTNIGHLESAAGIAGIIKVLMSMRKKTLTGIANFTELNPYIQLEGSPLYISTESRPWKNLVDKNQELIPRRAGISSFGFGGVNAHVVIEEYNQKDTGINVTAWPQQIFVLSAKNRERLTVYAASVLSFLEQRKLRLITEPSLVDIIYTFQTGRDEMEERLAFVVTTVEDLKDKLRGGLDENSEMNGVYFGTIKKKRPVGDVEQMIHTKNVFGLAEFWTKGGIVDWRLFYGNKRPRLISLPTYSFARQRYWIPDPLKKKSDTSTESDQRLTFPSKYTGREFFIRDHRINEEFLLPGVAYIEMVRSAGEEFFNQKIRKFCNIAWFSPIIYTGQTREIDICFNPRENFIDYEVCLVEDGLPAKVYSSGRLFFNSSLDKNIDIYSKPVDMEGIKKRFSKILTGKKCYSLFNSMGMDYGGSMQGLKKIYCSKDEVFAHIKLPELVADTLEKHIFHPSIMDSVFQSVIGLTLSVDSEKQLSQHLPFFLRKVVMMKSLTGSVYAHVVPSQQLLSKHSGTITCDITVYDLNGQILVKIYDFSIRDLKAQTHGAFQVEQPKPLTQVTPSDEALQSDQDSAWLFKKTDFYLKNKIAEVTKLPETLIKTDEPLEKYGIDSVLIMELTVKLETDLGELSKTLFFEYKTLHELSDYFIKHHKETLMILFGHPPETEAGKNKPFVPVQKQFPVKQPLNPTSAEKSYGNDDIAIIGIGGRYPMAKDINELWSNLKNGIDCITEIPGTRWNLHGFYDPDKRSQGMSYCKWGGFIDDIEHFDPLFFNMSPKEAELIDPQERLFLEIVWQTIEDAGYTRKGLESETVGVFAGVMWGHYQLFEAKAGNKTMSPSSSFASIANRTSYIFNFNGPSMAVDTMCSSSLTAIHLACESLYRQESDLAVAGGVNLSVHPNKYKLLSSGRFMSSDGRCRSFGQGGDGYVPGEGVGAVLLKPLAKAVRDRDNIYGIIKGISINHGGKTNGYTVPNPTLQRQLIKDTLSKAKVEPVNISYIEAHGTGTALGDPIEITALTGAFGDALSKDQRCAIGSVKSNIGHLESAAGVAGLTKVLLQMKHKKLVPSLHSEKLNSNIDFQKTRFYVQQDLTPWERPSQADKKESQPRMAGLSSFGAGGANAHLIIEEFDKITIPQQGGDTTPILVVLSAKNRERLTEYAQNLLSWLTQNSTNKSADKIPSPRLADIAYTLQVGREAMDDRLAMVVSSKEELCRKLKDFSISKDNNSGVYMGNINQEPGSLGILIQGASGQEFLNTVIENRELDKLASLWVVGGNFDWNSLYDAEPVYRISLPTYPFAREYCWIHQSTDSQGACSSLHPLIDLNNSTLDEQSFKKIYSKDHVYFRDHTVKGQGVLAGAVYIEMARAAGNLAHKASSVVRIEDIAWKRPFTISGDKEDLLISLFPEGDQVLYEITSENNRQKPVIHSQGRLIYNSQQGKEKNRHLPLSDVRNRCLNHMNEGECYARFLEAGLEYGDTYKTIQHLSYNETEAISLLEISGPAARSMTEMVLHPSIMDGAFQTVMGIVEGDNKDGILFLPIGVNAIEVRGILGSECIAYATLVKGKAGSEVWEFNIVIADKTGDVLVDIQGFSIRVYAGVALSSTTVSHIPDEETLLCTPEWAVSEIPTGTLEQESLENFLVFEPEKFDALNISNFLGGITITIADAYKDLENGSYELNPEKGDDYKKLVESLDNKNTLPDKVIHLWPFSGNQPDIERKAALGVLSLFNFIQALMKQKPGHKVKTLFCYPANETGGDPIYVAVAGFAKSVRHENPGYSFKTIGLLSKLFEQKEYQTTLKETLFREFSQWNDHQHELKYGKDSRYVKVLTEISESDNLKPLPIKKGVYLITGGAGGLGLIFAEYFAVVHKSKVVLIGRSNLHPDKLASIKNLKDSEGEVAYYSCDITDKKALESLIITVKKRFAQINGVIHCAGVTRDSFVLMKTSNEIKEVLAPKLYGTLHLDQCTKNEPLDFFVLFSSMSSVMGNPGQSDYAYANGFMDAFAFQRKILAKAKKRSGTTLSINWPLWRAGGMGVDLKTEERIKKTFGMVPMETQTGIHVFQYGLRIPVSQLIAVQGKKETIRKVLGSAGSQIPHVNHRKINTSPHPAIDKATLVNQATMYLKQIVSSVLKLSENRIDKNERFENLGMDSVMILEATESMEGRLGELPKTLFFEYQTLGALGNYLAENYPEKFAETSIEKSGIDKPSIIDPIKNIPRVKGKRSRFFEKQGFLKEPKRDIAVIGISGRYPMADDLNQFWANLKAGKDCITEIPEQRWNYQMDYNPDKNAQGKNYCKWGGFLDHVDSFDALFFNISPVEAELLDPQERLFLEIAWETIENAGYTPKELSTKRTGVFVGVMWGQYQLIGADEALKGNVTAAGSSFASIANRVSYCLNLKGPSMAVDTMCSSSLTAIAMACNSLVTNESGVALAGGVNLTLHPNKYIQLSYGQFASSEGKCRSFGKGGDGYVPGEGVGCVLLKPLDRAVEDGDEIHGVIRGWSVNHGGRTNGYTIPNPKAQEEVITSALEINKIDPGTISYVEAHGTGTALGDPIEIRGLTQAFNKTDRKEGFVCPIGSVKSNIGHLEAAAGIAGLTKVLLQMKHKQLVPSLHSKKLNPHINFKKSIFQVQQDLEAWRPTVAGNHHQKGFPLRAGISAFGAGGSNSHIVVEEYKNQTFIYDDPTVSGEQLIVISARDNLQLNAYIKRLIGFIAQESHANPLNLSLKDMAYTLQTGRVEMKTRMAVIPSSIKELESLLNQFLNNPKECSDNARIYVCNSGLNSTDSVEKMDVKEDREAVDKGIENVDLTTLAELWVRGNSVPWDKLPRKSRCRKIPLPTYPFKQHRHWIPRHGGSYVSSVEKKLSLPSVDHTSNDEFEKFQPGVKFCKKVEQTILQEISSVLKIDKAQIDPNEELAIYGLDSIMGIKIINTLRRIYGEGVSNEILQETTARGMAEHIVMIMNSKTASSYPNEASRQSGDFSVNNLMVSGTGSNIRNIPPPLTEMKTKTILISGVTGVLGGSIVKEYLESTKSRLLCLVRAENHEEGLSRVRTMYRVYDPEGKLSDEFEKRVVPVLSDISLENLGMDKDTYASLSQTVDLVIHNAAKVSLHGVYQDVKEVNVDGTFRMIEFALSTQQKYLIFVSSYTVIGDKQYSSLRFSESDLDVGQGFSNLGYPRSKYEGEKLIHKAGEKGLKWIIVRPGNIMGSAADGSYPLGITGVPGVYYDFLRTIIQMKVAVESSSSFDITPVDYISKGMVYLSLNFQYFGETYHLTNPHPTSITSLARLIGKCGVPVKMLKRDKFLDLIWNEKTEYSSMTLELIKLNPVMLPADKGAIIDATYTKKILATGNIICPVIDETLISTYVNYCIKLGYFQEHLFKNKSPEEKNGMIKRILTKLSRLKIAGYLQ